MTIFANIEKLFKADSMLWNKFVSLSVGNTNMFGIHSSSALWFSRMMPELFLDECSCDPAHTVTGHAKNAFSYCININMEDL